MCISLEYILFSFVGLKEFLLVYLETPFLYQCGFDIGGFLTKPSFLKVH